MMDTHPRQVTLENSTITFESGPAGVIARIDYHTRTERRYVGPLDEQTIEALTEVAGE